jgi:septal ring factor EnvC (AmiA/AmiB activator)
MNATITAYELCKIILAACGAVVTISGAVIAITNFVTKLKAPNKKQDDRISALEREVKDINDRLKDGTKHFEKDDARLGEIEKNMSATNKIIIESLQALTSHAIDGNNIQELKDAKKNLDEYLINRV